MNSLTWAIIIAGGKGEEFAPEIDTAFLSLGSKPILTYSLAAYEQCSEVDGVVIVAPKDRVEGIQGMVQMFGGSKVKKIVAGAAQRQTSVLIGLRAMEDKVATVSIHEASRPCVTANQIAETVKAAKRYGNGVLATKVVDSIKVVEKGYTVSEHLDSSKLWMVQTPQAFKFELILKALQAAQKKKVTLADDTEALKLLHEEIHLVPTDEPAFKIAKPRDLFIAECLLRRQGISP